MPAAHYPPFSSTRTGDVESHFHVDDIETIFPVENSQPQQLSPPPPLHSQPQQLSPPSPIPTSPLPLSQVPPSSISPSFPQQVADSETIVRNSNIDDSLSISLDGSQQSINDDDGILNSDLREYLKTNQLINKTSTKDVFQNESCSEDETIEFEESPFYEEYGSPSTVSDVFLIILHFFRYLFFIYLMFFVLHQFLIKGCHPMR